MSFNIKYRPNNFNEMIGNKETIQILKGFLKDKEKMPHTFLLHGESGCGKTTIARILSKELGCSEYDTYEYNMSNTRGIDTARSIMETINLQSLTGNIKVYILDECFPKGTIISTPNGNKNIEQLHIGESIYNIQGETKIKNVFKNIVSLDRIIKIYFSNGNILFTTKEHLILTNKGWKKAIDLQKRDLILKINCAILNKETEVLYDKDLSLLQKRIFYTKQKASLLFYFLQKQIKNFFINYKLWLVWKINTSKKTWDIYKKILFQQMCLCMERTTSRNERTSSYSRNERENQSFKMEERTPRKSKADYRICFYKNEEKQSNKKSRNSKENISYEREKWESSYLERKTWRKWAVYKITNFIIKCFKLGNGIADFFREKKNWLSNLLQSRYWKYGIKNSNRSRWSNAQIENYYSKRCQKRKSTSITRMENIEIYKRGNNDKSFSSIITDKERNQGHIEFYDLEIDGHPSYFANSILVHNCHKTTSDFQNAILKALEDTPKHVYFFLCTTDPSKLLTTIKNRCSQYQVNKPDTDEMRKWLKGICEKEGITPDETGINKIVDVSDNCPRQSLILLEKVKGFGEFTSEVIQNILVKEEETVINLCRRLLHPKASWKSIVGILSKLEEEPEQIRRAILGYMTKVSLSDDNPQAIYILECFKNNYYDSGKAGLILSCYEAIIKK